MAVTFAGGLNYLSTTSVPALNQNSAAFTGSIWIYPTNLATLGGQSLIAQNLDSTSNFLSVVGSTTATGGAGGTGGPRWADSIGLQGYTDGHFYTEQEVNFFAQEIFADGGALTLNAWNHLVLTFTASNMRTYVNGVAQGTSTGATATAIAWNRIVIGGFNGDASDAVLYNRELSASEIAALYKTRRPIVDRTGIVGYWPLFAGSSLVDHSGKGRTLTATGTVTDSTRSVPAGWGAPLGTILLPAASAVSLAGGGTSPSSGAAALSVALPIAGAGTSLSSGAATITSALQVAGAGVSPSSGTAALTSALPLPASSAVSPSSGAASLSLANAFAGSGISPTSGSAALTVELPIAATATSPSSGAAVLSQSGGTAVNLVAAGESPSSGAVALTLANSLAASAASSSSGSAGLTAALPLAGTGTSPSSGDAALTLANALASSGISPSSGAAALTLANELTAAAGNTSSGVATLTLTVQLSASSMTVSSGDATLSGITPPPSIGGAGTSGFRRRFAEVSPRRRVR